MCNSSTIHYSLGPQPLVASYKDVASMMKKTESAGTRGSEISKIQIRCNAPGQVQVVLKPVLPEESSANRFEKFLSQHNNFQIL